LPLKHKLFDYQTLIPAGEWFLKSIMVKEGNKSYRVMVVKKASKSIQPLDPGLNRTQHHKMILKTRLETRVHGSIWVPRIKREELFRKGRLKE
jgi:hypothetical protein